jgi:hypothetical protein
VNATNSNGDESASLVELGFQLEERRFDPEKQPPEATALLKLSGRTIATRGNLVAMSGQAKSGKSHGLAAIIASSLGGEGDFLGFEAPNEAGAGMIYLDCEQSREDFHKLMATAMRRASVHQLPDWFNAYHLTGWEPRNIWNAIEYLTTEASALYGGMHMLLIDGYADLLNDPNDAEESFGLVRRLMALAERIDCAIAGVLHQNAGGDSLKMRGHLGSQIERKCQTVVTFKRSEDAIVAFTSQSRGAPIFEDQGSRFAWSEEDKMFVSLESKAQVKQDSKARELIELANAAIRADGSVPYADLIPRIMELCAVKESMAKKRIALMRRDGFLKTVTATGYYTLGRRCNEVS